MHILRKTAVAGTVASAILAGHPASAQAPSDASRLAGDLALPVDATASYFNRATNTALTERCEIAAPDTVRCRVRIFSNVAQIDAAQIHEYSRKGGALRVSLIDGGQKRWTPDTFKDHYQPARDAGETRVVTLPETSPLFVREQNNAGRFEASDGRVAIHSRTPVTANRAFTVSVAFDDAARIVSLSAGVTVAGPRGPLSASGAASRPYTSYDEEHFERYAAQAARGLHFRRD